MMHWGNFIGMGYGGFGWVLMVLFWVVVLFGFIYLARQLFGGTRAVAGKESAADILKKKYAEGEITKDQYKEKLTLITKSS